MAISVDGADVNWNNQALACGGERQQCIVHLSVRYGIARVRCVVSMSRYDTSSILLRSMFRNTRQHCTYPRDCVVLLSVGGACRQSTLTGVGMRVSGPLCDNFMYEQCILLCTMSCIRVDSLSARLSICMFAILTTTLAVPHDEAVMLDSERSLSSNC